MKPTTKEHPTDLPYDHRLCHSNQAMTPRRKFVLSSSALLLSAGLAALLWPARKEPAYQGHNLSFWVAWLGNPPPGERPDKALKAVDAIGTNAIPYLLVWMERETPHWEPELWMNEKLARMGSSIRIGGQAANRARGTVKAFQTLGKKAAFAAPALQDMLINADNFEVAHRASYALGATGPAGLQPLLCGLTNRQDFIRSQSARGLYFLKADAAPALMALINALHDQNERVRSSAADSLSILQLRPDLVIPELIRVLEEPSPDSSCVHIAWAISSFGQLAIPYLRLALTNQSQIVTQRINQTIQIIQNPGTPFLTR
jgi:hypothetical protein